MSSNIPPDDRMERLLSAAGEAWAAESRPDSARFTADFDRRMAEVGSVRVVAIRRRRARWAMGIAAAIAITGLSAFGWMQTRPVGTLAFQTAAISSETYIGRGAELVSRSGERAIIVLDSRRIVMHMNENTKVRIASRGAVSVDEGEAWFEIVPNSGRFEVATPSGTVVVTGTTFGVQVSNGSAKVALASGHVRIESGKATMELTPGQEAAFGSNADEPPHLVGIVPHKRPIWSEDLLSSAAAQATARYYPSGAPGLH